MRVLLYNGKILSKLILPSKVDGSFWITDEIDNINLASIEAVQGKWVMKSNEDVKINFDNSYVSDLTLKSNLFATIEANEKKYFLCIETVIDNSYYFYQM